MHKTANKWIAIAFAVIISLSSIFIEMVYSSQITLTQVLNSTTKFYENKSINAIGDWETFAFNLMGNKKIGPGYKKKLNGELKNLLKNKKAPTSDYERTALLLMSYKNTSTYKKELMMVLNRIKESQLKNGKFADNIDTTGEELINTHILGIITLTIANVKFNKIEALKWLNSVQNRDGGFSFSKSFNVSDTDMTAIALVAYSKLCLTDKNIYVIRALKFLKTNQLKSGGFASVSAGGIETCETDACVINALMSLRISPYSKKWSVEKNNCVDAILKFYTRNGQFKHLKESSQGNSIATAQALMAIYSLRKGKCIYNQIQLK